ncbi:MAG: hypothetical protein H6Q04_2891 [Acidobacteria bacterium]|nr:hypothetical protein [Acidobacteriota bacterium]
MCFRVHMEILIHENRGASAPERQPEDGFSAAGKPCILGASHYRCVMDIPAIKNLNDGFLNQENGSFAKCGVPNGIRTRVAALKARCPRPTRR